MFRNVITPPSSVSSNLLFLDDFTLKMKAMVVFETLCTRQPKTQSSIAGDLNLFLLFILECFDICWTDLRDYIKIIMLEDWMQEQLLILCYFLVPAYYKYIQGHYSEVTWEVLKWTHVIFGKIKKCFNISFVLRCSLCLCEIKLRTKLHKKYLGGGEKSAGICEIYCWHSVKGSRLVFMPFKKKIWWIILCHWRTELTDINKPTESRHVKFVSDISNKIINKQ